MFEVRIDHKHFDMETLCIFVWVLFMPLIYGTGRDVSETETIEKLFNIVMFELRQKDERIAVLEKQIDLPCDKNPLENAEVTVSKEEEIVDKNYHENDMDNLQVMVRRSLHEEKIARLKTETYMIKALDDFKAEVIQKSNQMNKKINELQEKHNNDLRREVIHVETEIEKASTKIETESVARDNDCRTEIKREINRIDLKMNALTEKQVNDLQNEIVRLENKLDDVSKKLENESTARDKDIENLIKKNELSYRYALCDSSNFDTCLSGDCCISHQYVYNYNFASGKNAWQSSECCRGQPNLALDGNRDSNYHHNSCTHTSSESNPWWMVDLGRVVYVARIIIQNRGDCCGERLRNVVITVGMKKDQDGEECGRFPGPGTNGQLIEIHCAKKMWGQFVKIMINSTNALTLCEVEVYN